MPFLPSYSTVVHMMSDGALHAGMIDRGEVPRPSSYGLPLVYLRLSTLLSSMTKIQADFAATKWSFKSFEVLLVTARFLQITRDEFDAMIMNAAACRIPQ